jgi:hypothetical protein
LGGGFAMAGKAEGAEVVEVTLASAFGDGKDVVGVPEGAAAGDGPHAVEAEAGGAIAAASAFECGKDGDGVGLAQGADAAIAGEDLVTEVAGVGAEAMLMDAVFGAEGTAAGGEDFEVAPAAEGKMVGSAGEGVFLDAAAGEGASGKHGFLAEVIH